MVNVGTNEKCPSILSSGREWLMQSIHNITSPRIREHLMKAALTTARMQQSGSSKHEQHDHEIKSTEYLVHNWLESVFTWFQVIILWHEPLMSVTAISGILASFLVFTYFAPRFYATILIATFICKLSQFWFRHVWPEIRVPPGAEREAEMKLDVDRFTYLHPHLMTLAEFCQHLKNLMKEAEKHLSKLLQLRQERPVTFCSLICSVLSCTAYIGHQISGQGLLFVFIAIIMTAPGIYCHFGPEHSTFKPQSTRVNLAEISSSESLLSSIEQEARSDEMTEPLIETDEEQHDGFVML